MVVVELTFVKQVCLLKYQMQKIIFGKVLEQQDLL
jgi:hypothetical protein